MENLSAITKAAGNRFRIANESYHATLSMLRDKYESLGARKLRLIVKSSEYLDDHYAFCNALEINAQMEACSPEMLVAKNLLVANSYEEVASILDRFNASFDSLDELRAKAPKFVQSLQEHNEALKICADEMKKNPKRFMVKLRQEGFEGFISNPKERGFCA